eukprot:9172181-Ditylum_brightwellii.AAC.1
MKSKLLDAILTKRLAHWTSGQWHIFIKDYEADAVLKDNMSQYSSPPEVERDLKTIATALGHI